MLCFANRITNTELLLGVLNGQAHRSCRIVKLLNRTPTCFNLLCLACLSTFSFVFAVLVTLFNLPDNMLALLSGTSRPHHSLTFSVSLSLTLTRVSTLIKAHLFFILLGDIVCCISCQNLNLCPSDVESHQLLNSQHFRFPFF